MKICNNEYTQMKEFGDLLQVRMLQNLVLGDMEWIQYLLYLKKQNKTISSPTETWLEY